MRIGLVLGILFFATFLSPVVADCDCDLLEKSVIPCWVDDWKRVGTTEVTSLLESVELIGRLTDGSPKGEKCYRRSEFIESLDLQKKDNECLEKCFPECMPQLWRGFFELATNSDDLNVKHGAIGMCFWSPLEGKENRLHQLTLDILHGSGAPLTKTIILQWVSYHGVKQPEMMDAILVQLESNDALLREIADGIFSDWAGLDLPFTPGAAEETREAQRAAIVEWWQQARTSYAKKFEAK